MRCWSSPKNFAFFQISSLAEMARSAFCTEFVSLKFTFMPHNSQRSLKLPFFLPHNRTKHVERRHFFIRDMVEKFELRVPLVSTVNNYADFFTKPLKSKVFFGLRNKIMNIA